MANKTSIGSVNFKAFAEPPSRPLFARAPQSAASKKSDVKAAAAPRPTPTTKTKK